MAGATPARRGLPPGSERLLLAPFVIATGDASPRDQRDLMERPFFSLAKGKRTVPILYEAGGQRVEVFGMPEHGMATIWDADVLIWAASQIVEAGNNGYTTSRFLRFMPYQLLQAVGRATGASQYDRLRAAFQRLQSTVVATTIRHGKQWRRHQFSWINEWEELSTRDGRTEGMEIVLPEWFYRGVIDRSLVLAIDPAYFRLRGGVERWLYRVARKHAGHQPKGWVFEVAHLHEKSGSLAPLRNFALEVRRIAQCQSLPGYRLDLWHDGRRELVRIQPQKLFTGTVNNPVNAVVLSNAARDVLSNADGRADSIEESNKKESNSCWKAPGKTSRSAVKAPNSAIRVSLIGDAATAPPFLPANDWPAPATNHRTPTDAAHAPELPLGLPGGAR